MAETFRQRLVATLGPDFADVLARRYQTESLRQLAQAFGVDRETMATTLRRAGIPLRGRGGITTPPPSGDKATLAALVEEFGVGAVAHEVGVTRGAVYKRLWYGHGLKKRADRCELIDDDDA